jgi:prepilin-type N-terminal cleavage/methylation domain-containing protein
MTPPWRKPLHGEDGFALIEVLVSALILAIVAAGVMALLQATTRSAASERRHSEAYAIVQEDQARLRSMRLSALNRLEQVRTVSIDGNEFTVTSQGVFVNNTSGQPSSCTSGETSADYVRITSSTTWPGNQQPVVVQSIVSPSNGSLDPNHGTLVVTLKNAAAGPISGVELKGSGAGNFSGKTDSTGCANFTDLPAGSYSVIPNAPGLVDKHGESAAAQPTSISAGTTNTLPLELDYPATLPVEFENRIGSTPSFEAAKIDSVLVFNTLMNPAKAYWTPTKARESKITATPIFPFTSPDSVYAGACEVNNPTSGEGIGSVTLQPGVTAPTLKLKVPALEVTVKNGGSPISGATIMVTDENCKVSGSNLRRTYTSESKGHQSSAINGQAEYGLPYGTYEICGSANISGHNRRLYATKVKVQSYSSAKAVELNLTPGEGSEKDKSCP